MNILKFKGNFGELELSIDDSVATGKYQVNGTLSGEYTDNIFKGVWHNNDLSGLIEFSIINGKLDGKWKKGIEPGPMKSKWEGFLVDCDNKNQENEVSASKSFSYKGELINGERHGYGKWSDFEGNIFEGRWVKDVIVKGTITFLNGDVYEGDIENNKPQGQGKLIFKNGGLYEGNFVNGLFEGTGKISYYFDILEFMNEDSDVHIFLDILREQEVNNISKDDINYYIDFIKNKLDCSYERAKKIWRKLEKSGRNYYLNETDYEGDFKSGKKHGFGILHFANLSSYEGEFKNDMRSGKGELESIINRRNYKGEFYENKMNGKGILKIKDDVYDVEFKNDIMSNYGKISYQNGDFYEGELYDLYKHGKGKMIYSNGDIYDGNWKDDKREGKGEMIYIEGDFYKGNWLDDKKTGLTELEKALEHINKEREIEKRKKEKEEQKLEREREKEYARLLKQEEKEKQKLERERKKEELRLLKGVKKENSPQNKNQICSFVITYEVKLKQEAGFFNTLSAQKNAIESGKGFWSSVSMSSKKGGYREKTLKINHNSNSLSNSEAKNYISKNDQDVRKGVAGSSTINIISIKKWNG